MRPGKPAAQAEGRRWAPRAPRRLLGRVPWRWWKFGLLRPQCGLLALADRGRLDCGNHQTRSADFLSVSEDYVRDFLLTVGVALVSDPIRYGLDLPSKDRISRISWPCRGPWVLRQRPSQE